MKFIFALFVFLLSSSQSFGQQALIFSMPDDDLGRSTFEILSVAYEKIGISVKAKILPAKRALHHSSAGITDGEVQRVAGIRKDFPQLLQVPVEINTIEGIAFTCRKNITVDGWESLRNLKIGIRIGAHFAEKATKGMPHLYPRPTFKRLFDMLYSGGIDVVIASKQEIMRQTSNVKSACLKSHTPPLTALPLFHFLNEKHKVLIPQITEVLEGMYRSGEAQEIIFKKLSSLSRQVIY